MQRKAIDKNQEINIITDEKTNAYVGYILFRYTSSRVYCEFKMCSQCHPEFEGLRFESWQPYTRKCEALHQCAKESNFYIYHSGRIAMPKHGQRDNFDQCINPSELLETIGFKVHRIQ